jgi:hypothetical protein
VLQYLELEFQPKLEENLTFLEGVGPAIPRSEFALYCNPAPEKIEIQIA